ncbi:IPExxxVDY family protein [Vitellibacter sp. q18]|jgi:hypothetical protein|nr:IPExxxVDY family protein [Aequorivita lutea]
MVHHKLDMGDELEEPFTLIAVHCSEEDYKMAYLLNQNLHTRFKRRRQDIDFPAKGKAVTFPIFDFLDELSYSQYHLVANKCSSSEQTVPNLGSLFPETDSEKNHFLLPELKKVDYFIKVYSDFELEPLQTFVSKINAIAQVVSAYVVEQTAIKSKNNLIFD